MFFKFFNFGKNNRNIKLTILVLSSCRVKKYSYCHTTNLQNTFVLQKKSYIHQITIPHSFCPAPGTHHSAFCFYEFNDFIDFLSMGPYSFCDLFHSVQCLQGSQLSTSSSIIHSSHKVAATWVSIDR